MLMFRLFGNFGKLQRLNCNRECNLTLEANKIDIIPFIKKPRLAVPQRDAIAC